MPRYRPIVVGTDSLFSRSGPGTAGAIAMNTWGVLDGRDVVIPDAFKAYTSFHDSVIDHGRFLFDNRRYTAAFAFADDPRPRTLLSARARGAL